MGLWNRLGSRESPKHEAQKLLDHALMFSLASANPLLNRYGSLKMGLAIKKKGAVHWDFFVCAACVFVAVAARDYSLSSGWYRGIAREVFRPRKISSDGESISREHLQHLYDLWSTNGEAAVVDCKGVVGSVVGRSRPEEHKDALSVALGSWIIWNVLGEEPASEDMDLAGALGSSIAGQFASFWGRTDHEE